MYLHRPKTAFLLPIFITIYSFGTPLPELPQLGEPIIKQQLLKVWAKEKQVTFQEDKISIRDGVPENQSLNFQKPEEAIGSFAAIEIATLADSLTLIRDVFGVKSLFYACQNQQVYVSNQLKALVDILPKKPCINEQQVHRYFDPNADDEFITDQTFFEQIKRVLPGQKLTITKTDIQSSFYWQPTLRPYPTFQKSAEAFRKTLQEYIESQCTGLNSCSANLSGGLDSSTIATILSEKTEVNSIFFNTMLSASFEKAYANEVAEAAKIVLKEVSASPAEALKNLEIITSLTATPEVMVIPAEVFMPIMASSEQNLFSGHGGDSIVGYGTEFLSQLLKNNRLSAFKEALHQKFQLTYTDESFEMFYIKSYWRLAEKSKKSKLIHLFADPNISKSALIKWLFTTLSQINKAPSSVLKPSLHHVKSVNSLQNAYTIENQSLHSYVKNNLIQLSALSLETLECLSQYYQINSHYPFLNTELLEIAAAVNAEHNYNSGYLRGLLREATKGLLPENVRLRTQKAAFNDFSEASFFHLYEQIAGRFDGPNHLLWTYIDKDIFEEQIRALQRQKEINQRYLFNCKRVLYFGIWLDLFFPSS